MRKAEDGDRRLEGRDQKSEDRSQKTEVGGRKAEVGSQQMQIRSAKDLKVYQKAYALAMELYQLSISWPSEENLLSNSDS